MIATITLNPSLDEHIMVRGLMTEESNRWIRRYRYAGGKGIDVSRAIHEMNGITIAYGFIGGVEGETIKHLLSQQGVLYDFNPIEGEVRSNFIITDLKTHRQTRIDAPGPYVSGDELQSLIDKLVCIEPSPEILVFAGSVPPGIPDDIYKRLIETAKLHGVKTVLDSDSRWLSEGLKAKPDIIKPNVHETEELLGKSTREIKYTICTSFVYIHICFLFFARPSSTFCAQTSAGIFLTLKGAVMYVSIHGGNTSTI